MTSSHLTIYARSVYGTVNFYPINDAAKALAQIAGTKTLTPSVIQLARGLGMSVECLPDPALSDEECLNDPLLSLAVGARKALNSSK